MRFESFHKIIITFVILISALSISYYYVIFLPKTNKEKMRLENQSQCRTIGYELYEKEKIENDHTVFLAPEFKFNEKLGLCLYKGGFITTAYMEYFIKDVYHNKKIIIWSEALGVGNEQDFNAEYSRLFLSE